MKGALANMSETNPKEKKGLHTLGGAGEPAQPAKGAMRIDFAQNPETKAPALVITVTITSNDDSMIAQFSIQGEELETFYSNVKMLCEGKGKRPGFYG